MLAYMVALTFASVSIFPGGDAAKRLQDRSISFQLNVKGINATENKETNRQWIKKEKRVTRTDSQEHRQTETRVSLQNGGMRNSVERENSSSASGRQVAPKLDESGMQVS